MPAAGAPRQDGRHLDQRDGVGLGSAAPAGRRFCGLLLVEAGDAVAADLFHVAHHPESGRPLVSDLALGVGLVAAWLAVGLSEGEAVLRSGLVYRTDPVVLMPQELHMALVSQPASSPEAWLRTLAPEAPAWARKQLRDAGVLVEDAPGRVRKLLGGSGRCRPADPTAVEFRAMRARNRLTETHEAAVADAVLAGLIQAIGLQRHWLRHKPDLTSAVDRLVTRLPPDLRDLLALVQHVVASMALSPRH